MENRKVLIVDDDPAYLDSLQQTLESDGIIVFTSRNPVHALHTFEMEKPQIVICDLNLCAAMDGLTVCGRAKAMVPKTVTIAMACCLTAYDLSYCLGSGMFNDAITKPFDPTLLLIVANLWFIKRKRWDLADGTTYKTGEDRKQTIKDLSELLESFKTYEGDELTTSRV